jgi:hypothetical protein
MPSDKPSDEPPDTPPLPCARRVGVGAHVRDAAGACVQRWWRWGCGSARVLSVARAMVRLRVMFAAARSLGRGVFNIVS